MDDDTRRLLNEIDVLLAGAAAGDLALLARAEYALTAAYARALALESELDRLQRRMREAAEGADDVRAGHGEELAGLARRVERADVELLGFRDGLSPRRKRLMRVRARLAA